jgi:hypothetical protein
MCGQSGNFGGCGCNQNCNCASCQLKKYKTPVNTYVNSSYLQNILPASYGNYSGQKTSLKEEVPTFIFELPDKQVTSIPTQISDGASGSIVKFGEIDSRNIDLVDEFVSTHPLVRPNPYVSEKPKVLTPISDVIIPKKPSDSVIPIVGPGNGHITGGGLDDAIASTIGLTASGQTLNDMATTSVVDDSEEALFTEKEGLKDWQKAVIGLIVLALIVKIVK